ncbi:phospholipid transport system substrate-binding protein [Sphingomonas vulcanisoli]|uniref:Phospholipid transport system substrate-binding protein n=1 Tax=Sphingomonas vulcanisoli TaxID=1658060 RepID=A0ABX0TTV7_9SPHN|nr:phospholipid transport system substrate-binding protein [Sphingomonas vulcanisoli]
MNFRLPVAALPLFLALAAPSHAAEIGAAAHVAAYDDKVIAVMKEGLPTAQRIARFQTIVAQSYDMPAIAALVIGPGWASASAADKSAAIQALTRHSAISLARNFKSYSGEKFVVDPTVQQRGNDSIVKVRIGSDILYFRVHRSGSGWSIIDVISGGVSQLAVQKSDLASTAAGGAAAVAKRLQQVDAKAGG